jgi:hypothetical protein
MKYKLFLIAATLVALFFLLSRMSNGIPSLMP